MQKMNDDLEQKLKAAPSASFSLIVRADRDVTPYLKWLASEGIEVKRQFRLTPGVAITCRGEDALRLLVADWVTSIELDQEIRTM